VGGGHLADVLVIAESRSHVISARIANPAYAKNHGEIGAAVVEVGHEDSVGEGLHEEELRNGPNDDREAKEVR